MQKQINKHNINNMQHVPSLDNVQLHEFGTFFVIVRIDFDGVMGGDRVGVIVNEIDVAVVATSML